MVLHADKVLREARRRLCSVEPRLEKPADQNLREISQKKKIWAGLKAISEREEEESRRGNWQRGPSRRAKEEDVNRGEKARGERRVNSLDLRPTSVFHQSCFLFT